MEYDFQAFNCLLFDNTICGLCRKISGVPNGEYIESDKFSVTAHGMDLEWQLCLYPSGKDCEDEEHVSILLELVSRSVEKLKVFNNFTLIVF